MRCVDAPVVPLGLESERSPPEPAFAAWRLRSKHADIVSRHITTSVIPCSLANLQPNVNDNFIRLFYMTLFAPEGPVATFVCKDGVIAKVRNRLGKT